MPITGRLTTISTAAMLLLTMSVGSRAAVSLVEPNTALVSIAGTEIGGAASPAISGDGRFVIFIDDQERLDEGHDGLKNVFVRDMRADTATRVTLGAAVSGSVTAFDVTISQDAAWLGILAVDFDSGEVVSPALYVVSRLTGAARKIAPAAAAAFSGDGRYIAILSQSRLTPDDHDDESDIVVYDQVTGTYDRVTVKTEAATGKDNGFVSLGGISADGRVVAFLGCSARYVPNDTNNACDVFVSDRKERVVRRVSVSSDGSEAHSDSVAPAVSGDGRTVAFVSVATNLVTSDENAEPDVFVHDVKSGVTTRVRAHRVATPSLSFDGRFLAFESSPEGLVAPPSSGTIFVHDRTTGVTRQADLDETGGQPSGGGAHPVLAANGRFVAFQTFAKLTESDVDGSTDIYLRDLGTAGPRDRLAALEAAIDSNVDHTTRNTLLAILNNVGAAVENSRRKTACQEALRFIRAVEDEWARTIASGTAADLVDTSISLMRDLGCVNLSRDTFDFDVSLFRAAPGAMWSVTSADVDGNGLADAVMSSDAALSVFVGDGHGSVVSRGDVGADTGRGLTTADVNGDGKLDIVAANQFAHSISVFLNRGGVPVAFTRVDVPVESSPIGVAVADVTGDHIADVVVAQSDSTNLAFIRGRSSGGFEAAEAIALGYGSTNVVIADFDGDRLADVAAAGDGAVSVLTGDGAGGFSTPTHLIGGTFFRLLATDFDADGRMDLVVGRLEQGGGIQVLLNAGAGAFSVLPMARVPGGPLGMVVADFDTDGRPDIAAVSFDGIWGWRGHGDGSLGFPERIKGLASFDIAAADMNGDGLADLVSTAATGRGDQPISNLAVLLNRPRVFVTAPNEPVEWAIGSSHVISWRHRLPLGTQFRVEITRDEGITWTPVDDITAGRREMKITWTVTGSAASGARIRVRAVTDPSASDISNGRIAIAGATIRFFHPQSGIRWGVGSLRVIQWAHNLGTRERVNIDQTRDEGMSWSRLATDVPLRGADTSSFKWRVTGPPGHVRFRVTWTADPRAGEVSAPAHVEMPSIQITSPSPGASWTQCFVPVAWLHNLGERETMNVDVSSNNGITWTAVGVFNAGRTRGSFVLRDVAGPSSETRVRVSWSRDPSVVVVSEAFVVTQAFCDDSH